MVNFLSATAVAITLALPITSAPLRPAYASGLMTACSADIASLCNGVREGRGRISACLFAHDNKISTSCRPELTKVTTSRMFEKMIPPDVLKMRNTPGEAKLRQVCAADIKSRCKGVPPGKGRLLACLYAWSNKVSKSCHAEARSVLEHLK
ncbi:cysteine rich repeat-containing protein [Roseibium sp. SCP14]|uniref:cysteine rich repeat-containing protein n=1 Tax=Roseibium sp. SCP14 TaxID=3141375 RepID=UPI003334CE89